MSDCESEPIMRLLKGVACVVLIMWGIKTASHLLVILLMAVVLAYAFVPLPRWLMLHLHLKKTTALALSVAFLGSLNVLTVTLLYNSIARMTERLPLYDERLMSLFDKLVVFANIHNFDFARLSTVNIATSDRMLAIARISLREASGFVGDALLISILGWVLLVQMVETTGVKKSLLAEALDLYGGGVQRYITISAETGLVTAVANLLVFVIAGVDFPVLWSALYFFLHFIPNVGFIMALVPPTLVALLMLGWKKALLVAGSLIITELLTGYGLTPVLMRKKMEISFLEITVSLMLWGFLLGPAGAILAIPLTLTLRTFLEQLSPGAGPDESARTLSSPSSTVAETALISA
jgi:AI-2 transport protein TqsA